MPKRALTAASVGRIKPPAAGQVDYFDKGFPGLSLRVSYGGGRSFGYFYRIGGKLRRMTFGTFPAMTLAEAREAWRAAREASSKGVDPSAADKRKAGPTDFENVAREWLKRDQEKNRSHGEVKRIVERHLIPAWGARAVRDIGRRDILDVIDAIADAGAPIMARRVQAYVHRFFRWSVGRGIIESNPATALPKPGAEVKRARVLTDKELIAVWKSAAKTGWPFGTAIQLLILTGARREEIGSLRWSEIQDANLHLAGERTKNGQPHNIPLSLLAVDLIEACPRVLDSEFVFTTTGKTAVTGWSRAKQSLQDASKVQDWRIHDLRRTVATGLQRVGVSLQVIEAILGHVSGSRAGVVGVYQRHSFDDEKRVALDRWAAHVEGLIKKTPANVVPLRVS